uniref:Uncharacterized protein n=1 Tax=Amphimedon queenslandica TaxID=400682 RepID=A0A1X7VVX7_AMPQE
MKNDCNHCIVTVQQLQIESKAINVLKGNTPRITRGLLLGLLNYIYCACSQISSFSLQADTRGEEDNSLLYLLQSSVTECSCLIVGRAI